MNIEELKLYLAITNIIKNYKEVCFILKEDIKNGKSKQLQLKEWERYFKWHTDGNKFIIDDVYSIPKDKIDKRKDGNNSLYIEEIDKLIIHMCSVQENSKYHFIELSTNGMLTALNIINSNFSTGRNNINKFSRYLEIPIETLYDFFNSTHTKNVSLLESGLNKLSNKALIKWYTITKVCTDNHSFRKATDIELEGITEIEQYILKEMRFEGKKEVFLHGQWNVYQGKVNDMLSETMGLLYYFKAYHIITTKSFRQMLLEEREKQDIQNELNYKIQESCIKSAEKRHEKIIEEFKSTQTLEDRNKYGIPKYDSDRNRMSNDYVVDTRKIVKVCIDNIDTINLMKILEDIENEKYTYKESRKIKSEREWDKIMVVDDLDKDCIPF